VGFVETRGETQGVSKAKKEGHTNEILSPSPNEVQENFDKLDKKKAQITFPLRHFFPLKVVPLFGVLL
jgi:hypothetical protein